MNDERHLFLYAKHHYRHAESINEMLDDLKVIVGRITAVHPEDVDTRSIIYWLVKNASAVMEASAQGTQPMADALSNFLEDIHPMNCWKIGYRHTKEPFHLSTKVSNVYDMETAIIFKCLSILRLARLEYVPFDLGEPDETLLPLNKMKTNA